MTPRRLTVTVFGIFCLFTVYCAPVHERGAANSVGKSAAGVLTPAQAYAGEILSYLLQVVLGAAGRPDHRAEWASTMGRGMGLDYRSIVEVMADPGRSKASLLVFDTNILGISKVLYHYDPRLNGFKGAREEESIYPASELIALRQLLARKLHQGEKIGLGALLEREKRLLDPAAVMTKRDLAATRLRKDEMRLVRQAFQAEPRFFRYLESDSLIAALYRIGAVEADPLVKETLRRMAPPECSCRPYGGSRAPDAVTISILPSMTLDFDFGQFQDSRYRQGFRPTDFYVDMAGRLKGEVLEAIRNRIRNAVTARHPGAIDEKRLSELINELVSRRVAFRIEDARPLMIHPGNARQMLPAICPEADFSLILLGKDVYLAIEFDTSSDIYPAVPWVYIDIMDVQRAQVSAEVESAGNFVLPAIRDDIDRILATVEAEP